LAPEKVKEGSSSNLPISISPGFTADVLALIFGTCLPDPAFIVDRESGNIVACNQRFLSLLGRDLDFIERNEFAASLAIDPSDRGIFNTWQKTLKDNEEGSFEIRILRAENTSCPVHVNLRDLRWKKKSFLLAFIREISALAERESQLKKQIELQKSRAHEAIKSSLRMYQFNEKIRRTPLLAKKLLNLESEEQLFAEAAKILTSEEGLNYRGVNFLVLEGDALKLVFSTHGLEDKTFPINGDNRFSRFISRSVRPDETAGASILVPLQSRGSLLGICEVVPYPREKLYFEESSMVNEWQNDVLQDIGGIIAVLIDNLRLNREIKRQSNTDPLTEVYNRHYFVGKLTSEVHRAARYSRPVSIIFVDVDAFKPINDRYGHLQGDQVLRELARLLVENLRETDIVCRYGGDEFVILLPETDSEMAGKTADKLLRAVQDHAFRSLDNPEDRLPVTISIGRSTLEPGATEDDLLRAADGALYRAKSMGKNQVMAGVAPGHGETAPALPRLPG
jgi:diguanylate cyclase (GGDEF)-like protein